MNTGRLLIGLTMAILVEGSSLILPYLNLSAIWTQWIGIIRLVVLGAVICGLAVTGGSTPQAESEKRPVKLLRKKAEPPEKDQDLERLVAIMREKEGLNESAPPPIIRPISNDFDERLITMQKWIDETRVNIKKPEPEPDPVQEDDPIPEPDWKQLYLQSQLKNGRKK